MADRKRAPKINALNVERANEAIEIASHALNLLTTFMPPTPKLFAAIEMFRAYARDFECFRATNYVEVPGPAPAEELGSPVVSSFSIEKTELGPNELLGVDSRVPAQINLDKYEL